MLEIEFTDDALVLTERGTEKLSDLLRRPVAHCLWAIKWQFQAFANGISFHKSHKAVKLFAEQQIDSTPVGPARLIDVSEHIYNCVQKHGYCWTALTDFSEALTYEGETWRH